MAPNTTLGLQMKLRLFLLLILIVPALGNAQQRVIVQPDPAFTARLTELERSAHLVPLFREASIPKTREELKAALDWMRLRATVGGSRDPRYLLSYAHLLYLAGNRDMSSAAYLSGMLLTDLEAARCADPSAPAQKAIQLATEMLFLEEVFWSFPQRQRLDFLEYALQLEKSKPLGKPNAWLCSSGMRDMKAVLATAVESGNTQGISETKTKGGGTIITVDTRAIAPMFLSDEESGPARLSALNSFKKRYSSENPNPMLQGTPASRRP